jgi:hypothetical protein
MPVDGEEFVVDFPTLGDLIDAWVEHHCRVPDGFARRQPFKMADWQFWCTANHYRIRDGAVFVPPEEASADRPVLLNQAFTYRRSLVVAPQKTGKGPWSATIVCVEAVGPSLFAGWAKRGDVYECAANGCDCGWSFEYEPGEPKGMRHPSPLIQLTATSEDQVDNVYKPLQAMIRLGPLSKLMAVREGFVRILGGSDDPDLDRIDVVTSSARARLGNPITFAVQDESGLYTKANRMRDVADTQRRGAAGMGGRTISTTNAWDPGQQSDAQVTWESRQPDIFKFFRQPPKNLSYRNKVERARIHRYVYNGSWWVSLDSIEAEAAELMERDPEQAERFFGNRVVYGQGTWLEDGLWERTGVDVTVPAGTPVGLGFDGSDSDDWTAIRLETPDGHRFTPVYGPDRRPTIWNPAEWGGQIPRGEVDAAVDEICTRFRVVRAYCDPRDWQSEIGDWALRYGDKVFVEWATYRVVQMHDALERSVTDLVTGRSTHDSCPITSTHVANARKVAKPGQRYILGKPSQHQKIDAAMADTLAHEAAADARTAGLFKPKTESVIYTASSTRARRR